jgi:branched-chain amino acid transport system permease protein
MRFPQGRDAMSYAFDKPKDQQLAVWERFNSGWARRVRALIDDELIAEHRRVPRGPHSDRLARVLRYFRSQPIPGKLIVIEEIPWRRYGIGVLTGVPGRSATPLDDSYATYDEALHAIFLRRVEELKAAPDASR